MMKLTLLAAALLVPAMGGCGTNTQGQPASLTVGHPNIPGTVFTIVFENEAASDVLTPANPYFYSLVQQYGTPSGYGGSVHPSLPNYIMMTSGSTNGITTDNDPAQNSQLPGPDNIAAQLDGAQTPIMWRAYMESMGAPCNMASDSDYSAHHDPFLYYQYVVGDAARCAQHVVDFDQNFAGDLASGLYRYMWITPNMCNDMHNCAASVSDSWLATVMPQILASEGYKKGGVVFILFDEGNSRAPGAFATLPTLVISANLAKTPIVDSSPYDHASYLATVEDILGLGRLPSTTGIASMDDLFTTAQTLP
jgi:phosphatidylinositol-3-phosphatase